MHALLCYFLCVLLSESGCWSTWNLGVNRYGHSSGMLWVRANNSAQDVTKLKMHCSPDLSESKFAVVIVVWCYILSLSKAYLPSITSRSTTNCLQSVHQFKAFTYFLFLSPFKKFFHFFEAGNVSTLSGCCFCTDCNILLFLFPRTISQTFRILFCCCVSGVLNYIMAATLLIYGGRGRNVVTGYLCCYS